MLFSIFGFKFGDALSEHLNGFLVSKETVVLRWWESETKIGFHQRS